MARLNSDQTQKPKVPGVNIAGDYSVRGTEIAPDGLTEADFNGEAETLEAMETIAPSEQGHLSPADAEHMRAQREKVKRETLKASSQTQSTLGGAAGGLVNPSSDPNANTDVKWPVDE